MRNCEQCGKETTNPKFCSRSCAVTFNNGGVRRHGEAPTYCIICGVKNDSYIRRFCSRKCFQEDRYRVYIEEWLNGNQTGCHDSANSSIAGPVRRWITERSGDECEKCGWSVVNEFTGKVPLQIHHKDGNSLHNTPDNLEHLCPNCHSLTDTFGGANRGKGRENRYKSKTI